MHLQAATLLADFMSRTNLVKVGNTTVVLMDFSGIVNVDEALRSIEDAMRFMSTQKPTSVLTLTDVSGSKFDTRITEAMKRLVAHNKPYVIAGAVVGIEGLKRIVFQAVLAFSGRKNLRTFDTRAAAEEWLVQQKK